MKKKNPPEKKVFTSSKADRGILVKISNERVMLSFWGNDNPKNISFSKDFGIGVKVRVSSGGKPNLEYIGYKCLNGNEIKK